MFVFFNNSFNPIVGESLEKVAGESWVVGAAVSQLLPSVLGQLGTCVVVRLNSAGQQHLHRTGGHSGAAGD